MAAGGFSCAVCLEDYPEEACAELPCCTIPATATTRFCRRCIEIICESAPGGVGRCPNCRSYVRVSETGGLETADQMGTCTMCTQLRVIVESRGPIMLCDSCLLGTNHALRYECDGCGRFQRIPHPMWRYQQTPNDFGTDTWFCHVRCNAQTHWRLAMQDASLVPPADTPESWGRQVLTLAHVFFMFSRTCQARTCPPVTCLLMCATLLQAGRVACIHPSAAAARAGRGWGQRRPSSPHTRATRERAGEYSRMRRHAAVLDAVECRRLEAPFGRRHLVRRIHAQVRTWRTRQEGVILGAIIRTDACRGGFKCTVLSNGFLYDRFHTRIIKHSLNYNFNLIFIYIGKGTY